jgi:hypothetical protein
VAGSNDFAVEHEGVRRFVRALVVLGNLVPNMTQVARAHRGLLAGFHEASIDWTPTLHTVAFEGHQEGTHVLAAKNVVGYRDRVANSILHGAYQGELLQIVGRMRGQLEDPVTPGLQARVYVFASIAIPGWHVDEVLTLDQLRERVGLDVEARGVRGRPSTLPLEEQVRRRWKTEGATPTMRWLVRMFFPDHGDDAVTHARLTAQRSGLEPSGAAIRAAAEEAKR